MSVKKPPLMGIYSVGGYWVMLYQDHESEEFKYNEAVFSNTDQGIIALLYAIKEDVLGHYNSKHNKYNIVIERKKVRK